MTMQRTGGNSFTVTARLTIHKYDGKRTDVPGVAPMYGKTYRYTLRVDSSGNPIGGTWLSSNPDFLWVPLALASCASNNPKVNASTVQAVLDLAP